MPFGGKVVVFGGDFRQVLPILPRQTQKEVVGSVENSYVQLPDHIIRYYTPDDDPVSTLAATIFPEIKALEFDSSIFNERAIITPMNEDVDTINKHMISMFPGISTTYMNPRYVPLDKLTPKSKKYKIKVKVKEKSPAKFPENKKAFQKLVFEDDEGNTIRGTLFDDEIENFQNILEHEKEYIIADAPIRNTNPLYRHKEGDYYLSFGGSTAIQSLNPNSGLVMPKYIPIAEVPPTSSPDDCFDILGVVVYLEDTKKKKAAGGYEFDVRDVIVVDDSMQKVGDGLVISLYGELATKDCAQLSAWILENQDRVSDHMGHHLSSREGSSSEIITTVKDLNKKTVSMLTFIVYTI
ncbi:uncharacterized protein LOC110681999 [Chenopodium quinoa]|uniref:uncharacterized protein LOC110681999 n=1 Tax=Chenopodium quinoa TaxID=63459 RepID=UPI000B780DF1|nr:uncharacterized protein LOC110681999 [Chenopodium quinoa]